jgi:hypothetical protein
MMNRAKVGLCRGRKAGGDHEIKCPRRDRFHAALRQRGKATTDFTLAKAGSFAAASRG